jgi:hypothetical protein
MSGGQTNPFNNLFGAEAPKPATGQAAAATNFNDLLGIGAPQPPPATKPAAAAATPFNNLLGLGQPAAAAAPPKPVAAAATVVPKIGAPPPPAASRRKAPVFVTAASKAAAKPAAVETAAANPFNSVSEQPAAAAAANPFNMPEATVAAAAAKPLSVIPRIAPPPGAGAGPRRTITFRTQSDAEKAINRYKSAAAKEEGTDPYLLSGELPPAFLTPTRLAFQQFVRGAFDKFGIKEIEKPDYERCQTLGKTGEGIMKKFVYQEFVREYLRQETPYRGLLIYHGLGSGKTCTAVAAAEALYGRSNKKIIVMTPSSLKPNFQGELTSCGFKHFHIHNRWIFLPLDEAVMKFALDYLGLAMDSKFMIALFKLPEEQRGLYVPDMGVEPAPNSRPYKDLGAAEATQVRKQLTAMLEARITFLSYNSTRDTGAAALQKIVCEQPDFFDNAVIVIDEVHNVTRMMCRKMDRELDPKKRRVVERDGPFEPITPDRWKPALCGTEMKYKRAYLLYRLLVGAKNSKIVALSGTPLINFPEELAILSNIINGYNHTCEMNVMTAKEEDRQKIKRILELHPRVDFIKVKAIEANTQVTISLFPDNYKKVLDAADEFQGIVFDKEDPALKTTIQEVQAEVATTIRAAGMTVGENSTYVSFPMLPPTQEDFYNAFLDGTGTKISNEVILKRRIQGLISYYRGSKKDLMPEIVEDSHINVEFGEFSYFKYLEARKKELESKSKSSPAAELLELEDAVNPAYYRFRSRSACNFVFPSDIERPFPETKKEIVADTGVIDASADVMAEEIAIPTEAEQADRIVEEGAEGDEAAGGGGGGPGDAGGAGAAGRVQTIVRIKTYSERCEDARRRLYERRDELLKQSADPNVGLAKHSPKMNAILKKLDELEELRAAEDAAELAAAPAPGGAGEEAAEGGGGGPAPPKTGFWAPALVYSQFMSMEGLGIFGMVLEANGYVPIELTGPDENLRFSERTRESLLVGPEEPVKRFCFFTGAQTAAQRKALLSLFNGRINDLPTLMKEDIVEFGYEAVGNKRGEMCYLIGITAAGAEGISLKNVRSVHIMEPYWNSVRTDQVKGRAVRICSHMDLPLARRNVRVYTYCANFNPTTRLDESLRSLDGGLTSDQYILELAKIKDKVNQGLLRIIKETAVDCNLNLLENLDVKCYNPRAQNTRSYSYNPDINDDLRDPPQEAPAAAAAQAQAVPLEESNAIKALMAKAAADAAAARQAQAQEDDGSGSAAPAATPEALPPPPPPPPGLPVRTVPEIEIPAGSGKTFIMIPKPNKTGKELFTLFAKQDIGQTRPLGLLLRDPLAASGFRVKWN